MAVSSNHQTSWAFTEGVPNKTVANNVTLTQARELVYTMITTPNLGCKTCGLIPIGYPNVTDGTNNGGVLKIDFRSDDNCIGNCVGPNSFNTTTSTTATATTSATATASAKSAAKQLEVPGLFGGLWTLTIIATVALLGSFSVA
jgi:hypothetical protein